MAEIRNVDHVKRTDILMIACNYLQIYRERRVPAIIRFFPHEVILQRWICLYDSNIQTQTDLILNYENGVPGFISLLEHAGSCGEY